MDFDFVNDNLETAYLAFGVGNAAVSDDYPTGTYVVPEGTTVMNNGTIAAAGETISLNDTTTFEIAPGETLSGVDITQFESGRFLISLGDTLVGTGTVAPTFQFNSSGDSGTRWDKIEATIVGPTSVGTNAIDLTSTDFVGVMFKVQDIPAHGTVSTIQTSDLSMSQTFADIIDRSIDMSNAANVDDVITGAGGVAVTLAAGGTISVNGTLTAISAGGTINVLRIIAPSTVGADGLPAYGNLDNYIDAAKAILGATGTIDVSGEFSGGGTTSTTSDQDFSFITKFDSAGDLLMVSQASTPISTGTIAIGAGYTITIASAQLESGLVGYNPTYSVTNPAGITTDGKDIGDNDVYSTAVRNILGGFGLGFVESTEIIPNTTLSFADSPTADWYSPQLGNESAYGNAQPSDPTYYDQYAAVMASLGNAYGFPFSDLLSGVQLGPQDSDTVDVTIDADAVSAPCFARGTRITTPDGERAVETLQAGDRVLTISGEASPILWIGHREIACVRHPAPATVLPVRIAAGAFGFARPTRDLYLSPDHAVFVEGVLIPVKHLVNGCSVAQMPVASVHYFHVELARHDVLLAEGLPVESYLDTGDRVSFENGGGARALAPVWGGERCDGTLAFDALGYAPLRVAGPEVARVKMLLAEGGLAWPRPAAA